MQALVHWIQMMNEEKNTAGEKTPYNDMYANWIREFLLEHANDTITPNKRTYEITNRMRKGIRTCNINDHIWHSSCRRTQTAMANKQYRHFANENQTVWARAFFLSLFVLFFLSLQCHCAGSAASAHFPINNKISAHECKFGGSLTKNTQQLHRKLLFYFYCTYTCTYFIAISIISVR